MITIKIGKLPGRIREVTLPEGSSVGAAIAAAELTDPITPGDVGAKSTFDVRVNAEEANADTVLNDGDTVLLVKKIKGN